ncbi:MAG: hypothetical protein U0270_40960 [Labilithrix sp.]
MNSSSRIAAAALVAMMASLAVACEDTSQPDVAEAYASDLTDGTSTSTDGTEPAAAEEETAPVKTPAQADADDATSVANRRAALHSVERAAKKPLKAE